MAARQDLLAATEVARNKIVANMVTKYDVQMACDTIKDEILESIQAMRMEDQSSLRQANATRDQIWRKLLALEKELKELRGEIRSAENNSAKETV